MGGISLGPLVLSADRAPVVIALAVLLLAGSILARRFGAPLSGWAGNAALAGLIAARAGHVAAHAAVYAEDPLSALAVWQGGFSPAGGAAGFAAVTALHLWRHRANVLPVALVLGLAALAFGGARDLLAGGELRLPQDVTLAALDGAPVPTGDWAGRPMIINLWASWCPPCRRELPMMAEVARDLPGVEMHFVNQGEPPETIRRHLSRAGLVIAPLMDPEMRMMQHFEATGLPVTLFIDAEGRVVSSHMGEISRAALLAGIGALAP